MSFAFTVARKPSRRSVATPRPTSARSRPSSRSSHVASVIPPRLSTPAKAPAEGRAGPCEADPERRRFGFDDCRSSWCRLRRAVEPSRGRRRGCLRHLGGPAPVPHQHADAEHDDDGDEDEEDPLHRRSTLPTCLSQRGEPKQARLSARALRRARWRVRTAPWSCRLAASSRRTGNRRPPSSASGG